MGYSCSICNKFIARSYQAVLRHMKYHQFNPNLSIKCGIGHCQAVYSKYESFRSHVYRKHREAIFSENYNPQIQEIDSSTSQEAICNSQEAMDRVDIDLKKICCNALAKSTGGTQNTTAGIK